MEGHQCTRHRETWHHHRPCQNQEAHPLQVLCRRALRKSQGERQKHQVRVALIEIQNHEVKVSAKQVADEVRGLVDLCPTDCAENKKLQAVGKFEDHTLYMLHEGCS